MTIEEVTMNADYPILVGYDGSKESDAALRWALEEARVRRVAVRVIHSAMPNMVTTGMSMGYYAPDEAALVASGNELLAQAQAHAHHWAPDVTTTTKLRPDQPCHQPAQREPMPRSWSSSGRGGCKASTRCWSAPRPCRWPRTRPSRSS